MYFDAFTISALVDELMDSIVGGRIQDVIDVDMTGLGLEIYANRQRYYLYMSADHQTPRVHRVDDKLRRGLQQPTQLGLLFRRYVEGGILTHVSQPTWERVLIFDVVGAMGDVSIVIEPMERRSNILLLQDGIIIDCMRRVGPEENRYRLSLPKHEYVPPPPMTGKQNPITVTEDELAYIFMEVTDAKKKAFRVLSGNLLGMSPLLAKEIVFRTTGKTNTKASEIEPSALHEALNNLMSSLSKRQWKAGIADVDGITQAYSVYPIEHVEHWQTVESVSQAVSAYYGGAVGEDMYNQAKQPVREALEDAMGKVRGKLHSLQSGLRDETELEILKQSGELILAYQYAIRSGQTVLQAQYDPSEPEINIKLNPDLSPVDNAQNYFTKYNKAKRARDDVPQLIDATQTELDYLAQLQSDLETASNWGEIDDVIQSLQSRGHWQGKKVKRIGGGGRTGPLKLTSQDGYVIWVGRNSRQNEEVTFKKANAQDIWLHAREVPGAHVVIRDDGRRIKEELIAQAAAIAAYYSAKRDEGKVEVDYTRCKHVRKIKGAGAGMVTYRNEKTLLIQPQNEEILSND